MSVLIRDATPADTEIIAGFNMAMAAETEDRALDGAKINAGVAALLADREKGRYWVATDDDAVVGQIMTTYEWSDWRNGSMWWIQSVYVAETHRGRGVFKGLFRHVETLAREDKECRGLRLYVERDNTRAQQVYRALGMVTPGYRVMETDFDMPGEGDA